MAIYRPDIKPPMWGPPDAVQYAVRVNAERMGVDPGSIALAMPFWHDAHDYSPCSQEITLQAGALKFNLRGFEFSGDNALSLPKEGPLQLPGKSELTVLYRMSFATVGVSNDAYRRWFFIWQSGSYVVAGQRYSAHPNTNGYDSVFNNTFRVRNRNWQTRPYNLGYIKTNDTLTTYEDGLTSSWDAPGSFSTTGYANETFFIGYGGHAYGNYIHPGTTYDYFFVFLNGFSVDDVSAFHHHPYALLMPVARPVFFDLGGEPPGPGIIQALAIDGFAFSDITTRRATYRAAAFDSASFAELDQRYAIFHKDAADGLSMLDAALRNLLMSASSSDNATFADSATIQALLQALSQDSIDLSDTATGDTSSAILALASDSIAVQSSAAARASLAAILAETISVADTVAAIGAFFATVQESISIADLSTLDSAITAIAGDNVTLSDASARTLRAFLLSADTINVSDDGSVRAHFSLSVSDAAHLSETVSAIGRFYVTAVDAAGFSEDAVGINTSFLPKGVVSISFCVKQATFTFTIKQPSAGFSVRASETSGDDKCRL